MSALPPVPNEKRLPAPVTLESSLLILNNEDKAQPNTTRDDAGYSYIPPRELDSKASHLIKETKLNYLLIRPYNPNFASSFLASY